MLDLPIFQHREAILTSLSTHNRLLLNAPTGSGKSTGIPPILFKENTIVGRIIIVQPRRLAARLLAQRVAQTLKLTLGEEVGYSVRFDTKYSEKTKILFLTDGVLLRQMSENPTLHNVGLIIFDEFHERRIASDIALGYCKDLQKEKRNDLKLLVMSATLAEESLENYLSPCAKINAEGRAFPVEIHNRAVQTKSHPRTGRQEILPLWEQVKSISREIIKDTESGNWLIFMPGTFEIRKTIETLSQVSWLKEYTLFPLYSSLSQKLQIEAIECKKPKIIVTTNVAETSLTIDGIRTVIDTGLARESRYDPTRDMDSLLIHKISQASATQRAGRAGRTAAGNCYRLWSVRDQESRSPFQLPEALRIDISPTLLLLADLGYSSDTFSWLETPATQTLIRAKNLLIALGAIDEQEELTKTGKALATFPLPPRLSRLLLAGVECECLPEALFAAALLQAEPFVKRSSGIQNQPTSRPRRSQNSISDFEEKHDPSSFAGLFAAYAYIKANNFSPQAAKPFGLSLRALRELDKSLQQLKGFFNNDHARLHAEPNFHSRAPQFTKAIALTFPDRLCYKLGAGTLSCKLLNKQKGKLEDSTPARKGELFFASQIQEIEGRDVLTHLSGLVQVEPKQLVEWFPKRIFTKEIVVQDEFSKKIICQELTFYRYMEDELEISAKLSSTTPDPHQVAELMADTIIAGKATMPKWDHQVEQWLARLNCLAEWMPELELPKIEEEEYRHLLIEICMGVTRTKEIKLLDPWPTLNDWLSPAQNSALKSFAPTEMSLDNGSKVKIRYTKGASPTISVKLQKLYDVIETPTLSHSNILMRVEILAPNQRPWQITSDLPNFWKNGYPQMKKDLAGRYPKHEWR